MPLSLTDCRGEAVKVDAAVCKARGLSAPEKVVVDEKGTTYYCCKRAAPTEGYEEAWLVLSPESKIVSITGVLHFNDKAASERLVRRAYSISTRR